MSQSKLCRLCINACDDFKQLYHVTGRANEMYEMILEYFHPKFVNMDEAAHLTVVCLQCFRIIHDFHSFQTSITIAQLKLLETNTTPEEVPNPQEETSLLKMVEEGFMEKSIEKIQPENLDVVDDVTLKFEEDLECLSTLEVQPIEHKFVTHPDLSLSSKEDNNETIPPLALQVDDVDDDSTHKHNIYLPELEIIDVDDTSSTFTSDDEIIFTEIDANESQGSVDAVTQIMHIDDSSCAFTSDDEVTLTEIDACEGQRSVDAATQMYGVSPHTREKKYEKLNNLLAKWLPNLRCEKCPKTFQTWSTLTSHFKLHHPNEKFHIICCDQLFTDRVNVRDHLLIHNDPDAFKCELCGRMCAGTRSMYTHMSYIHPENSKFECNKCGRRCSTKKGLMSHYREIHNSNRVVRYKMQTSTDGRREYVCQLCGKHFLNLTSFKNHELIMHGSTNSEHTCTICSKSFRGPRDLAVHMTKSHV